MPLYGYVSFCCSPGHLRCFHFWLLWIMLQWTFMGMFLCGHTFSVLLSIYLGVELLGHVVNSHLTIWGTTKLFSRAAAVFSVKQTDLTILGYDTFFPGYRIQSTSESGAFMHWNHQLLSCFTQSPHQTSSTTEKSSILPKRLDPRNWWHGFLNSPSLTSTILVTPFL